VGDENMMDPVPADPRRQADGPQDFTRFVLLVLVIGVLLTGSFLTLLPFLGGLIWAATLVIATWPVFMRLERAVGGRRSISVTIMTLAVLLAFVVPLSAAISTVLDAANRSPALLHDYVERGLGPPPQWVSDVPAIGPRLADRWATLASGGPEALAAAVRPYARSAAAWIVTTTGGLGRMIVHVLLTVILVGILYGNGETAARGALAVADRLGGEAGQQSVRLAAQAVRSVALGVVVTALIQSSLAGLGLWVSGVPHPGLLTAIVFTFSIAQLGPLPVLIPAIAWLYWVGRAGWATALLVWTLPVAALDNVIRPILIRRGVQLPMLLIIGGVIGGLITFGVIGLFVGPVILAATFTLAKDWVGSNSHRS
jgi:predicted PurR-regulated permease PerM